jgi:hypothetical protein
MLRKLAFAFGIGVVLMLSLLFTAAGLSITPAQAEIAPAPTSNEVTDHAWFDAAHQHAAKFGDESAQAPTF